MGRNWVKDLVGHPLQKKKKKNFFPLGRFAMISNDSFPWSFVLNSEFIVVILVNQF